MRKTNFTFLLAILMSMVGTNAFAYDAEVDGIYYNFLGDYATVTYYNLEDNSKGYKGDISIPKQIVFNGKTYHVSRIDMYAFKDCVELTSISIPMSVDYIGYAAFQNCKGLKSVTYPSNIETIGYDAFLGCETIEIVNIIVNNIATWCEKGDIISYGNQYSNPSYYTAGLHLYNVDGLEIQNLVIPDGVNYIGENAFANCIGITGLVIPEGVNSIGKSAFEGCTRLTSVSLPTSLSQIGVKAFYRCTALLSVRISDIEKWLQIEYEGTYVWAVSYDPGTNPLFYAHKLVLNGQEIKKVVVPSTISKIKSLAFAGGHFDTIILPPTVTTIEQDAFSGTELSSLYILNPQIQWYYAGGTSTRISYNSALPTSGNIYSFNTFVVPPKMQSKKPKLQYIGLSDLECLIRGVKFNCHIDGDISDFVKLKSISVDDKEIALINTSEYFVNNLIPSKEGKISSKYICLDKEIEDFIYYKTKSLNAKANTQTTQTKVKFEPISYTSDETTQIKRAYYKIENKTYEIGAVLSGLVPEQVIYINPVVIFDDDLEYIGASHKIQTKDLSLSIQYTVGPTTIQAKGSFKEDDAHVKNAYFEGHKENGNEMLMTALNPNKEYTLKYIVETEEGSKHYTTKNVRTANLSLITQQPKVVSLGNVIVAAEANIDDEEKNVGFEWRRTDWSDSFLSNTGTANMVEGTMEGYIRNLNTEKLWKFRPYYLADNGTYYYGDWVGIDPTNVSYFEPTVHTYAKIAISGNTALVKGYALGGSDDVTVQGFKYWKSAGGGSNRAASTDIPDNAKTIEASGTVMEVSLSGLDYDSSYSYVAFATTSKGTYYGDIKTFETGNDPTGINTIKMDNASTEDVHEVARFNMQGRRIVTPEKGINIIKMSDGTTRKILVK